MANANDIQSGITVSSVEAKWLVAINAIGNSPRSSDLYIYPRELTPTLILVYYIAAIRYPHYTLCDDVVYPPIVPSYLP